MVIILYIHNQYNYSLLAEQWDFFYLLFLIGSFYLMFFSFCFCFIIVIIIIFIIINTIIIIIIICFVFNPFCKCMY